ncbi:MAG: hypothetical protein J7L43_01225 [Candidatus Aenigmarchaeota archaeon]|nr:hypothetical protein [Candidatus Aenigmarchaeota archaeon]
MNKCPVCGSTNLGLDSSGLKFCRNCGTVIHERWNGRRFYG